MRALVIGLFVAFFAWCILLEANARPTPKPVAPCVLKEHTDIWVEPKQTQSGNHPSDTPIPDFKLAPVQPGEIIPVNAQCTDSLSNGDGFQTIQRCTVVL